MLLKNSLRFIFLILAAWLVSVHDETGEPVAVATILTMVRKKV